MDTDFSVTVTSFGYRNGVPNADVVFDVRCLPSPHVEAELLHLTGRDERVRQYIAQHYKHDLGTFLVSIEAVLERFVFPRLRKQGRKSIVVAMGCSGGQHRSVLVAERIGSWLERKQAARMIRVMHRDCLLPTETLSPLSSGENSPTSLSGGIERCLSAQSEEPGSSDDDLTLEPYANFNFVFNDFTMTQEMLPPKSDCSSCILDGVLERRQLLLRKRSPPGLSLTTSS